MYRSEHFTPSPPVPMSPHHSPKGATSVETDCQFEAILKMNPTKPFLIQFGSPNCTRCPAYGRAIHSLWEQFDFLWLYCDTHSYDGELLETYQITRLPAFVLGCDLPGVPTQTGQGEPEEGPYAVESAIRRVLAPKLDLDADF